MPKPARKAECHPTRQNYIGGFCKSCHDHSRNTNPVRKKRERERQWRRRGINLTYAQYEKKLSDQSGVCAICGKPPKSSALAVDHNHKTGLVRGLLCYYCNRVLLGRRTTFEARRVADYLEKYDPITTN